MLDKRQIQAVFLFEFKMGHQAAETTPNISNTFGPGTANELTVQWWFKKFYKGDECLEDEEHSSRPSGADREQLRAMTQADPLTPMWEVVQDLNINHSVVMQHSKQTGKAKKVNEWVPHKLTTNKKNCLEVSSYSTWRQTISWSDCGMWWKVDFIW